ncbi:hypothetical protein CsSME_00009943 [Camellia sinensis var. sinensis]
MVPILVEKKDLLGRTEQALGSIARSRGARSLPHPPNVVVRSMSCMHTCSVETWLSC